MTTDHLPTGEPAEAAYLSPIPPAVFVEMYGVALDIVEGPKRETDDEGWEYDAYTLRLSYVADGAPRRYLTPWRAGTKAGTPTAADVVADVASDLNHRHESWEDYASGFGLDEDSRRGYAMWEAVRARAAAVEQWASHWPGMFVNLERVQEV